MSASSSVPLPAAVSTATKTETVLAVNALKKKTVEEKFEKYFGYLARCEGNFCIQTIQNRNFGSKFGGNAEIDFAKI